MRPPARPTPTALAAALLAVVATAGPAPARADEPIPVRLAVGERRALGGSGARCDDLAVVAVTIGPEAIVTGLKPGATLCSAAVVAVGGARRVFRVTVVAAAEAPAATPPRATPPKPPAGSDGR